MTLISNETIAVNLKKVVFSVDHDAFEAAINKVFKKASKNITIPGFRKGKAPRALVEKMYGKEVFYEDAINEIIPDAYAEAMKDCTDKIVSRPEFDLEQPVDENGVVISATYYVKPEVEIKDYLGIPAERPVVSVSDDEVTEELKKVQNRNARMIEITDRAAQIEDITNIDFEGFVDGEAFEGGKAEGHELKLGSGAFIPGFEEQIVGKNIGEEFDVNVTFPEEYHADNLKGKAATFKCKLNSIKFNELPVLDDEFAKDVSEFDTLDEYKTDILAKLTEQHNKQADGEVTEALINALIEKLTADIPECMFDNEVENFVRDYDNRLRMNGLDLETYFKYTGLDLDTLRKQMRPDAERQVKTRLALEKIAELEGIAVSDEEIEAEYTTIATNYNMEIDKVKELVETAAITEDLKVKKAMELVREKAVITDKVEAVEEPAAEEAKEADAE